MEYPSTVAAAAALVLTALVRALGFLLIALGLWALVTVAFEAVGLYRDPARIDVMVGALEQAAGLHGIAIPRGGAAAPDGAVGPVEPATQEAMVGELRPAYLLGWFMAVLLFLVIGKLADWLISRGLAMAPFRCRAGGRETPT